MKGRKTGQKGGKQLKKEEDEQATPHSRAQKWADRLLSDISEAKTIVLRLAAAPYCESVKASITNNSKKLETQSSELAD